VIKPLNKNKTMTKSPYNWLNKSLETIHKANWYRREKTVSNLPGSTLELEGKTVINFASNDYLGLAGDERLIESAIAAVEKYGTGSTGSRLLSGHRELHRQLERAIAHLKQTEDALVFSSGYLANLGTISAIVGSKDLILGDLYNHSSLKNGAKLSGATVIEYLHCDLVDLAAKLEQNRHQYRRCLITTDSVFSMDGDICQVPDLLSLGEKYDCMVLFDEAHATGVMGKTGAGCVEHFGCSGEEMIQIGTLSKALGSLGGYVAGSATLIDFLRNRSPSWIYTTALSPADTAAALRAIAIVESDPQRRAKLGENVTYFKQELSKIENINILPSESPIICLGLESAKAALIAAEKLKEGGIFAPAIRPPTVPTSRIRISLMATHTTKQIDELLTVISDL
jgi:8-amino-7-oxononanoate synthase